jgi:hypothetical protein
MNPEQMAALACAYRMVIAVMDRDVVAFNAAVTDAPMDSTHVAFAFCGLVLDLAHIEAMKDGQLRDYIQSDLLELARLEEER